MDARTVDLQVNAPAGGRTAALHWVITVCLLTACSSGGVTSGDSVGPAESDVPSLIDQIGRSTTSTSSTHLVEATDLATMSEATVPSSADVPPDTIDPDLVPFWFVDLGVVGAPGLRVGDRPYYTFVTLGNSSSPVIRLESITFPEVPAGLVVRRVELYPEDRPTLAWPDDAFPVDASPVTNFVLEPTNGIVDDVFEDPRFVSVFVEVEIVADGRWVIGPMDVTYEVDGTEYTRRVADNVGSACTTPADDPCIPHLE